MKNDALRYKRQFIRTLDPFFDMLLSQRVGMDSQIWISMINRLESSIILNVDQYLGNEVPSKEITTEIVKEIFEDFVQDHLPTLVKN